jgi:hypothetical protein
LDDGEGVLLALLLLRRQLGGLAQRRVLKNEGLG